MKKTILAIAFLLLSTMTFAQTMSYGVKAGLNLSTQIDNRYDDPKNVNGFQVGGLVNIGFKNFDIQPQLIFITKGKRIYTLTEPVSKAYFDQRGTYNYIEIPLKMLYHFDASDMLRVSVGLGPYAAYALWATSNKNGQKSSVSLGNPTGVQRMDYGASFTAGVVINKNLLFNVDYDMGIANVLQSAPGVTGYEIKNRTLGFSVGYLFQ